MTNFEKMQGKFDNFQAEIRQAKNASGCTIQEIADGAGVPLDFAGSITSGGAKRPSLYYSAAVCAYLGLSMDELMGMPVNCAQGEGIDEKARAEIDRLKIENERLKTTSYNLEIENAQMHERVSHFKHLSTIYRPMIFGLIGICAGLLCTVIGYIIFDIQLKNAGLFRPSGLTVLEVFLAVIVLVAVALVAFALKTVAHDAKIMKTPQD